MAQDKERASGGRRGRKVRPVPYDEQQLSPRRADEQDMPEQEREITPLEEAGYQKGSTEGLAERDED